MDAKVLETMNENVVFTLQIFAIIVFGLISSQGWTWDNTEKKDVCIMNGSASACHFSTFVGVIGFLAAAGFLVGEWFFEQFSSIKTRKHYVIVDMAFSGIWAFFYFVAFCFMCYSWSKAHAKFSYGSANIVGAIFFAFCSIGSWTGSAFFAYQRFQAGADSAFGGGMGEEGQVGGDDEFAGGYAAAAAEGVDAGGYSEPPFSGGGQGGE